MMTPDQYKQSYPPHQRHSDQFDLFLNVEGLPPHQRHSRTSRASAIAVAPRFKGIMLSVFEFLQRHPEGATDEEMQINIPIIANSQRPARVTLVKKGLVIDSGMTRKSISGRDAVVWKLK